MATDPAFSLGVEEEYLLVDIETFDLAQAPEGLMEACQADLEGKVSPEFLQCQIEIGTGVCTNIAEAREEMRHLRSTVAKHARTYGLAPIAASCHPFADWKDQHHTDKDRYNVLHEAMAGVARRLLICGMHVHVGIDQEPMRIDLISQLAYFLPHLLAMSCSSPYWQGDDTGLSSYRLTVFDSLPRTGLPPQLGSWDAYQRALNLLVDIEAVEDGSKIWWDLRPSARFPTIEARICDVSPRLETTLTLAAIIQSTTRMLWRLARKNQRWRQYDNFLISENRWLALRYGMNAGLIDFGARKMSPFADLLGEWLELIAEDAEALGCLSEVMAAKTIAATGNSADAQRAVYRRASEAGADHAEALRRVTAHLVDEFHHDL